MTDDKIAEIRKRSAFANENKSVISPTGFSWTIPGWQAHNDRAFLLAEVERLNKDLATQQGCCDGAASQDAHVRREREEHRAEVEKLRSEIERMRDVLRRVVVYPSGDRAARVAFVSVGCQVSFPLHPQTTWALELLVEFDQARRKALEGKP